VRAIVQGGLIVEELGRPLDHLPVETDGAQRAAELIHELV